MDLPFHVYKKTTYGGWKKLGEVLYQADAEAMLEKWNSGYISQNGSIIVRKGY